MFLGKKTLSGMIANNTLNKTSHKLKWNLNEPVMCTCGLLLCLHFMPDKWLKGKSFLFAHSSNKSHSYVYLKFICLSEKCKRSKSSIARFTYWSSSNVAIVLLLPQHWKRNFSARYNISLVSDCFPNWFKRSQPCIREFWWEPCL